MRRHIWQAACACRRRQCTWSCACCACMPLAPAAPTLCTLCTCRRARQVPSSPRHTPARSGCDSGTQTSRRYCICDVARVYELMAACVWPATSSSSACRASACTAWRSSPSAMRTYQSTSQLWISRDPARSMAPTVSGSAGLRVDWHPYAGTPAGAAARRHPAADEYDAGLLNPLNL